MRIRRSPWTTEREERKRGMWPIFLGTSEGTAAASTAAVRKAQQQDGTSKFRRDSIINYTCRVRVSGKNICLRRREIAMSESRSNARITSSTKTTCAMCSPKWSYTRRCDCDRETEWHNDAELINLSVNRRNVSRARASIVCGIIDNDDRWSTVIDSVARRIRGASR